MTYPYPVPEGIEIVWETDVRDDRQDACWYMDTIAIATVRYGDREVMVDRNGELSVVSENGGIVKNTKDWLTIGIRNDNDLWDRDDDLEWSMNPWFDSYERVGDSAEHLDLVEYSVYDAVKAAIDWMINND